MDAYCVKCKTKREMHDPVPEYTKAGAPGTRRFSLVLNGVVCSEGIAARRAVLVIA